MNRDWRQRERSQRSEGGDPPRGPGFGWGTLMWLLIGLALFTFLPSLLGLGADQANEISYSMFRQQLESGNVQAVEVSGETIRGTLKEPVDMQVARGQARPSTDFVTYLPSFGDEELLGLLEVQEVEIETRPTSGFSFWEVVLNLLPFIALVALGWMFLSRLQVGGEGLMSMVKSRAKEYDRTQERTTFDDVAGAEGAKAELQEIIEFLKDPSRFERLGGEMPTGVLLVGPPGTGKTLLARAVAGEADVPFFSISGSDFMEMFVGVGASRVRDLFEEAKKSAPSIIFIDELDSIGRRRGAGLGGGHDEREQTLNQLLSEMDGFEPNQNVIVMAATNRPDVLDPALLRPGRFDRQVTVDLPTMRDRLEILKIHARNKPLSTEVDLERLARGTPGFSGADLENLLNETALLAARANKRVIEEEDVEEARDKVLLGLERNSLALTDDELELLAYHEAGHAVVAALLPHADPIHKVTVVPRGRAMGVTQQLPEREKYVYPREYLLDRLAVMMGGRAAEALVLGTVTSGAENDLKEATKLARKMVLDWGMGERFRFLTPGGDSDQVFLGEELATRRDYSEMTAREADQEIRGILEAAYERATGTLRKHRQALDRVAKTLVAEEELPGDQVLELISSTGTKSPQGSGVEAKPIDVAG